jgi:hypothetical protein
LQHNGFVIQNAVEVSPNATLLKEQYENWSAKVRGFILKIKKKFKNLSLPDKNK